MNVEHLYIGDTRNESGSCRRTVEVVVNRLKSVHDFSGNALLDVGCGEGVFTRILGHSYHEVHGIDLQENNLRLFRESVRNQSKYHIYNMSASHMEFHNDTFDTIISIEAFEHILDIQKAASECARVLKSGGNLIITVPNRFFPCENHGVKIGSWEFHGRVPLLPWFPYLHSKFALARVFSQSDLVNLFSKYGLTMMTTAYLWPTFEHGGNPLQPFLKPLFPMMRLLECSPIALFGTSIVVVFRKI